MYLDYFGFDEPPFSITPDPKYVFLSEKHQESLAHLVYGITRGGGAGFVQLTGEVGTGKTTISRLLLEQVPDETNIALILNPTITPIELLENICKELKISMRGATGQLNRLIDKLNQFLINSWTKGENTVVIIDEAQNLPRDTLEQLRLLTNLETDKQKLLQIILIGQPELRDTMNRNDLRQLAQRVTARYHLMPLSNDETYDYLKHRIIKAGGNANITNFKIAKRIHKITNGVPRLINIVADRALLAAYADNSRILNTNHINLSAREVLPNFENASKHIKRKLFILVPYSLGVIAALIIMVTAIDYYKNQTPQANNPDNKEASSIIESIKNSKINSIDDPVLLPNNEFISSSTEQSWNHLFELWNSQTDKKWYKTECPLSQQTGMACLRRQGNLAQIKKLNHPVLLQLQDETLVLLSFINDDKIGLLNKHNKIEIINQQWLNNKWLGTYYIMWSMPAQLLQENTLNQMNDWALEMANTISTTQIDINQLTDWIITFQKAQGLKSDGIIGSETQMALSLNAYNGPNLTIN